MKPIYKHTAAFATYALFFLALFYQFPSNGNISGNCDNWFVIAYSNAYWNKLVGLFTGVDLGTALYPVRDIYSYGESAPVTAILFLFYKLLGCSDVWANYFFTSTVFALNGFGMYLLARLYTGSGWAALFSGFVFSASNFIFGNMDSVHAVFFFLPFMSWYFAKRYLSEKKPKLLYLSALTAGIQAYCSAYVFLFLCIILLILLLVHCKALFGEVGERKHVFGAIGLLAALATPFFAFYFYNMAQPNFYTPFNKTLVAEIHSLNPEDFTRSLKGNLIYKHKPVKVTDTQRAGSLLHSKLGIDMKMDKDRKYINGKAPEPDEELYFVSARVSANIGVLVYLLALAGLFLARPAYRRELLWVFAAGLVIALGPGIVWGNNILPGPAFPFYEYVPIFSFIRVPCRAFFLCIAALSLLAASGILWLSGRRFFAGKAYALPVLSIVFCLVFLLENVPFKMDAFAAAPIQLPPPEYASLFKKPAEAVILELPSEIGVSLGKGEGDVCQYNREIIYMNWQNRHHQNIVNGVNGYLPQTRVDLQKLIYAIPDRDDAVAEIASQFGVTHIIFHKNMGVYPYEFGIMRFLVNSPYLKPIVDTERLTLFEVGK